MLAFIILFVVTIGVITVGMFYGARWAGDRLQSSLVARLQAGESIVNDRQAPAAWLAPYRARIATMRAAGKSEADVERVGKAAQRECLRRADDLIQFFDKRRVTASPEVQAILLSTLRSERARWSAATWQQLVETPPPQPPAA